VDSLHEVMAANGGAVSYQRDGIAPGTEITAAFPNRACRRHRRSEERRCPAPAARRVYCSACSAAWCGSSAGLRSGGVERVITRITNVSTLRRALLATPRPKSAGATKRAARTRGDALGDFSESSPCMHFRTSLVPCVVAAPITRSHDEGSKSRRESYRSGVDGTNDRTPERTGQCARGGGCHFAPLTYLPRSGHRMVAGRPCRGPCLRCEGAMSVVHLRPLCPAHWRIVGIWAPAGISPTCV
jgi:hypothetical protein